MKSRQLVAWGLLCLVFAVNAIQPKSASATVIDGVYFESSVLINNVELKLKGVARLRYLVVIKAYVGALYLPDGVRGEEVLDDVPKRLVLEYFHAIKARDFYAATRKMIEKNTDTDTLAMIENELDRLSRAYRDVTPHDRYALTYFPGYGTELSLNGTLLGTFKGEVFARAMFSIWLGENPIDKAFSRRLRGEQ